MPPDSIGRAQGRGRQMNLQGQRASDGRWGHALLPRVGHCPGGLGTALPPATSLEGATLGSLRFRPRATFQAGLLQASAARRGFPSLSRKFAFPEQLPSESSCHSCQTLLLLFRMFSLTHRTIFPFRKHTQIPKSQCSGGSPNFLI